MAPPFAPLIVVPTAFFRDLRTIDPTHYYSTTTITNTYSDQEDRMKEALDAIHDGYFISASAAAKHFNLKPRRVQYRLRGKASRKTRPQFHKRLTNTQESTLCDYINYVNQIKHSIRLKHIRDTIEYILKVELSLE